MYTEELRRYFYNQEFQAWSQKRVGPPPEEPEFMTRERKAEETKVKETGDPTKLQGHSSIAPDIEDML